MDITSDHYDETRDSPHRTLLLMLCLISLTLFGHTTFDTLPAVNWESPGLWQMAGHILLFPLLFGAAGYVNSLLLRPAAPRVSVISFLLTLVIAPLFTFWKVSLSAGSWIAFIPVLLAPIACIMGMGLGLVLREVGPHLRRLDRSQDGLRGSLIHTT